MSQRNQWGQRMAPFRFGFSSWFFVAIFVALIFITYLVKQDKTDRQRAHLENQASILQGAIHEKNRQLQVLKQQLNSQNDPEYLEFLLMQELGVIPKGSIKVLIPPKERIKE